MARRRDCYSVADRLTFSIRVVSLVELFIALRARYEFSSDALLSCAEVRDLITARRSASERTFVAERTHSVLDYDNLIKYVFGVRCR